VSARRTPKSLEDIPRALAVFPLEGVILLPRAELPLNIFEPRYLAMIDDALAAHRMIGILQPDMEGNHDGKAPPLYTIGGIGRITQFAQIGEDRYVISLTGVARFKIMSELQTTTPYRICAISSADFSADLIPRSGERDVDRASLIDAMRRYLASRDLDMDWEQTKDAPVEALVNAVAMSLPLSSLEKQAMLEAPDLKTRAEVFTKAALIASLDSDQPKRPLQ
jgi:uncharacterized protein